MMDPKRIAQLVWPELVMWAPDLDVARRRAAEGFGGFCVYGGTREELPGVIGALRSAGDLLICADYEDGAGQWVTGATWLPTNAAVGRANAEDLAMGKGAITGAEARELGVDWVLAPVLDLDVRPENPIVNVRSFGASPALVGRMGASFSLGLHIGGALSCGKHFPGHGEAAVDSHLALPRVPRPAEEPFRRAWPLLDAIMIGHLVVDSLDPEIPATLSPRVIDRFLRGDLGYDEVVMTDAMTMKALDGWFDDGERAVRAVEAGCDVVLYPRDAEGALAALVAANRSGRLPDARLEKSLLRLERARRRVRSFPPADLRPWGDTAERVAQAAIRIEPAGAAPIQGAVQLVVIRDDSSAADPTIFTEAMGPTEAGAATVVVAIYSRVRAYRGAAGLPAELRAKAAEALGAAPRGIAVLFGNPYVDRDLPPRAATVYAYSDDPATQRAVARILRCDS